MHAVRVSCIFTKFLKNSLLISFIPLPILMTLHILSYQAIPKSARQFHLDDNSVRTMKQVQQHSNGYTVLSLWPFQVLRKTCYHLSHSWITLIFLQSSNFIQQVRISFYLCQNTQKIVKTPAKDSTNICRKKTKFRRVEVVKASLDLTGKILIPIKED